MLLLCIVCVLCLKNYTEQPVNDLDNLNDNWAHSTDPQHSYFVTTGGSAFEYGLLTHIYLVITFKLVRNCLLNITTIS